MGNHIRVARGLVDLLDNKFGIGKFRVGLDPLLGLIPGIGDAITVGLSLYIVWIRIHLKLPQEKIIQMVRNIITDFVVGLVPVVGDIFDVFYKANHRNMKIIEEYTDSFPFLTGYSSNSYRRGVRYE